MIYNLLQYFKDQTPSLSYSVNGVNNESPKDVIVLTEASSTPKKWIDTVDHVIQIMSRAEDSVIAREQIVEIYNLVDRKYGLMLPATIKPAVYPEIKTYQMTPLQAPTWFEYDSNGLAKYVFNLQIITR